MSTVAVVTDSTACLPPELVQTWHIRVVPFGLLWGREVLRDGVDLTPAEFYQRLRAADELPTTSQPSVGDFLAVYEPLTREAEGIVSIHIPQALSGTVNAAQAAARMLPDVPVQVVDCGTAAMAQGFVVLAAARAAATGADPDQVVQAAGAMIPRVHLYATLETLTYLARSGRVPEAVALVGSALHIQPVFTMRQGWVDLIARVRTKERAVEHMLERMAAQVRDQPVHASVFHADVPDEAEALRREIAARFACAELYITEFTPVMGAHTGPGVLGIAFYAEEAP